MPVSVYFRPDGLVDIQVDNQRLSRLNKDEIKELVASIVSLGGKELREQFRCWLDGDVVSMPIRMEL